MWCLLGQRFHPCVVQRPAQSIPNPPTPKQGGKRSRVPPPCQGRYPKPSSPNPTPHTLQPTFYTLHPSPYTLNPTSYTLHPTVLPENRIHDFGPEIGFRLLGSGVRGHGFTLTKHVGFPDVRTRFAPCPCILHPHQPNTSSTYNSYP